ncbi:MAG: hypothetical protein ABH870_03015 [bacterium]
MMWINRKVLIVAGIWCLLGNVQPVYAQQETGVEVRLAKIEARLDSIEQQMEQRFAAMNQQFVAMEKSMDQRFADIQRSIQRFVDMMFWLQIILSAMVIGIGSLIVQWFIMWKKIIWCDTRLEQHLKSPEKDRLIDVQREEIDVLKNLLGDLQQRLTGLEGVVLKAR